jgi:hypothetical protein
MDRVKDDESVLVRGILRIDEPPYFSRFLSAVYSDSGTSLSAYSYFLAVGAFIDAERGRAMSCGCWWGAYDTSQNLEHIPLEFIALASWPHSLPASQHFASRNSFTVIYHAAHKNLINRPYKMVQ